MEYVIPIIVVVLLVAGFVTFLVLNAANKGGAAAEGEPGPPGIGADEQTPLGDTPEHADAEPRHGGERRFGRPHETPSDPDEAAHVGRPGEGEGSERLGFDGQRPRP